MATAAAAEQHKGRFYGVYLLCSQSPKKHYKGKCYVGFTVNPNRRINQHNKGKEYGGARKTSSKGPWKMVMIVHGFPNNIAALQFEWAWQQPSTSTRLKEYRELGRKLPRETHFQYHFRILSRMLLVGPWNRLPLIVRWLETDYECNFSPATAPPPHMQIVTGSIAIAKGKDKASADALPAPLWAHECHLCMQRIENVQRSRIGCLNPLCKLTCHVICLANHLIYQQQAQNKGQYIPIAGECPMCETKFTWAALLQRKEKRNALGSFEEVEEEEDPATDFECLSSDESATEEPALYELSD